MYNHRSKKRENINIISWQEYWDTLYFLIHLILLLLNIDIYRLDMVAWETTDTCKISNFYHLFKINTRRYFQRFHVGVSSHLLSANINHMKSHHCLETEACHSRWFRWYFLTSTSLDIHQNGAEGSILKIDTVGWEGFYQSSMYCIIRILVNMIWLEVEEGSVSGSTHLILSVRVFSPVNYEPCIPSASTWCQHCCCWVNTRTSHFLFPTQINLRVEIDNCTSLKNYAYLVVAAK